MLFSKPFYHLLNLSLVAHQNRHRAQQKLQRREKGESRGVGLLPVSMQCVCLVVLGVGYLRNWIIYIKFHTHNPSYIFVSIKMAILYGSSLSSSGSSSSSGSNDNNSAAGSSGSDGAMAI